MSMIYAFCLIFYRPFGEYMSRSKRGKPGPVDAEFGSVNKAASSFQAAPPRDHSPRVPMIHIVTQRIIAGNAAPTVASLPKWLENHPGWEIHKGKLPAELQQQLTEHLSQSQPAADEPNP